MSVPCFSEARIQDSSCIIQLTALVPPRRFLHTLVGEIVQAMGQRGAGIPLTDKT